MNARALRGAREQVPPRRPCATPCCGWAHNSAALRQGSKAWLSTGGPSAGPSACIAWPSRRWRGGRRLYTRAATRLGRGGADTSAVPSSGQTGRVGQGGRRRVALVAASWGTSATATPILRDSRWWSQACGPRTHMRSKQSGRSGRGTSGGGRADGAERARVTRQGSLQPQNPSPVILRATARVRYVWLSLFCESPRAAAGFISRCACVCPYV